MIDIEKIKQAALDALSADHVWVEVPTVLELATRLEAAERGLSTYTEMYNRVYDELEAAEKDAARYQWMRDNHDTASTLDGNIAFTVEIETNVTWTAYTFHDAPMPSFDDAVDNAMKGSE